MGDLLGNYPDLMDGFNEFLARCEKNGNVPTILLLSVKLNFLELFLINSCCADGFLSGVMHKSK